MAQPRRSGGSGKPGAPPPDDPGTSQAVVAGLGLPEPGEAGDIETDSVVVDLELDAVVDAVVDGEPEASDDETPSERDDASGRAPLASIAAHHSRPVKDFIFELRRGTASKDWIEICRSAMDTIAEAARSMGLEEPARLASDFDVALCLAETDDAWVVTGVTRELILDCFEDLLRSLPEAFALDEDQRRESAIIRSLLHQIPGVGRVTFEKLYGSGLTLEALCAATVDDLASATGIPTRLCERICNKFKEHVARLEQASPADESSTHRTTLAELVADLRRHQLEVERADYENEKERKRAARKSRKDSALKINALLAEMGALDLLEEIERQAVGRRIERLEAYLQSRSPPQVTSDTVESAETAERVEVVVLSETARAADSPPAKSAAARDDELGRRIRSGARPGAKRPLSARVEPGKNRTRSGTGNRSGAANEKSSWLSPKVVELDDDLRRHLADFETRDASGNRRKRSAHEAIANLITRLGIPRDLVPAILRGKIRLRSALAIKTLRRQIEDAELWQNQLTAIVEVSLAIVLFLFAGVFILRAGVNWTVMVDSAKIIADSPAGIARVSVDSGKTRTRPNLVAVTQDELGRITSIEAGNPTDVLWDFCRLSRYCRPGSRMDLARPASMASGVRFGLVSPVNDAGAVHAITIHRNSLSRKWVAGDGRNPILILPLERLSLDRERLSVGTVAWTSPHEREPPSVSLHPVEPERPSA